MLYKDKKETISFLGELISYTYIFSAFFSSKLNMKVGYLLLIVSFLYICINKDIIKLVNKKIYGMFLLILILGCFWNYISAGMIGMSKFININTKFFYGIAMFPFLVNIKKDKFNILIFFLSLNILNKRYKKIVMNSDIAPILLPLLPSAIKGNIEAKSKKIYFLKFSEIFSKEYTKTYIQAINNIALILPKSSSRV